MTQMTLYGMPGWGSAITEAQLAWYGLPFAFAEVGKLFDDADARARLEVINPLGQVPTLVLSDGTVMTESAAITLWLAEQADNDDLVPEPGSPDRARFLRWLIFLIANVYPTYTYADVPARFVPHPDARDGFRDTVWAYGEKLYRILESEAGTPWFLGDRFSALDIYLCTMTHWEPRRPWFDAHAPKLAAIADAAWALPKLAETWRRNFPNA